MPDPTRGERGGPADARPELVVVCGAVRDAVRATGAAMRAPGTVVVAPDLRELGEGVVHRVVTDDSGSRTAVVELTHGCVSCTLREDLLPLLLSLAADRRTLRVVLLLDPGMEPEPVCEALAHLVAEGADGPVTDVLALRGVVAVLDAAHWLDDAGPTTRWPTAAGPPPGTTTGRWRRSSSSTPSSPTSWCSPVSSPACAAPSTRSACTRRSGCC